MLKKLQIYIETAEECLDNFNLSKVETAILNQDLAMFKEIEEYLKSQPDNLIAEAMEEWVKSQDKNKIDNPLIIGAKSYSMRQVLDEIRQRSTFGISFMKDVLNLTIDLIARGKRKID